jgi:hypothetical protein
MLAQTSRSSGARPLTEMPSHKHLAPTEPPQQVTRELHGVRPIATEM